MSELKFAPQLLKSLRTARHVAVLTGAGISAESGLPTFRDKLTGLWAKYDPYQLGTPEAFQANPQLVWEWFAWRRDLVAQAEPNAGHRALVEMSKHTPMFSIYTQNVDGLHQAAGSQNVYELHGSINKFKCFLENTPIESWSATDQVPPPCPNCGGPLRPDVVWFGENLPKRILENALLVAQNCDVYFSIGTSGTVQPAASLPEIASKCGATTVTINLEVGNRAAHKIYDFNGKAGEILPALVAAALPA